MMMLKRRITVFIGGALLCCGGITCLALGPQVAKGDSAAAAPRRGSQARCYRGRIMLGKTPMIIRLVVQCSAPGFNERAYFSVSRYLKSDNRRKGNKFLGFSKDLQVAGGGGPAGRGSCSEQRFFLACHAQGNGHFTVRGWLRVRKGRRCGLPVAIVALYPGQCHGECLEPPRVRALADGKPSGC